jgi:hypothetical protein
MPVTASALRTVTVIDTAVASTNLGDQIIMEAVRRQLAEVGAGCFVHSVASHEWMGRRSRRLIAEAAFALVGGSNLLSSRMWWRPLWKVTPFDVFRRGEIVLLGVGWYQDQGAPDLYSRWLLRGLLSRELLHSVRDSQALAQLARAGVPNVVNTGCPTLWDLDATRCAAIPRARGEAVVTTVNTYLPDRELDRRLLETLRSRYRRRFLWPSTAADADYALALDPELEIVEPSVAGFDRLLDSDLTLDYVGNRLHAGIRALQRGRRTIVMEVDNRARTMGGDFGLPTVARDDLARLVRQIETPFETALHLPWQAIARWKAQFENARRASARAGRTIECR